MTGRWAILNGVLVLIVLLLGLQIAWTWSRALPPVEMAARQADPLPRGEGKSDGKGGGARRGKRGAAEKVEQQPATLVATIVNKDLFDPSRQKPTQEAKAPPPKEIGPPPNLTLVGVRMIGGDREVFLTDAAQANQQRRLRIGDQVGGYTLKTVQPSRVTLTSSSGETITLSLAIEKSGGATPKAPGGPTPRPGQPAAPAPSPAAGVQPPAPAAAAPAPGVVPPRAPRAATGARARTPPAQGTPPGAAPAPAASGAAAPSPTKPPPAAPHAPFATQNLPAAVREKLEQLKQN